MVKFVSRSENLKLKAIIFLMKASDRGVSVDWGASCQSVVAELGAKLDGLLGESGKLRDGLFEAEAAVIMHQMLPMDDALADPEFWIWFATTPGASVIRRRYPSTATKPFPDRLNFTSPNARETLFYRLWLRGFLAHDPALEDPYELARCGDVDFWRSHVFRQMSTEMPAMLAAFVRFQYPSGPAGERRLSQLEIRTLVKQIKRACSNIVVECFELADAQRLVENEWKKIEGRAMLAA
jgi:hypothetical protein